MMHQSRRLLLKGVILSYSLLLLSSCFSEKVEPLAFFEAKTLPSIQQSLTSVQLNGEITNATRNDNELELGFLYSDASPDPLPNGVHTIDISLSRPTGDDSFLLDTLLTGLCNFDSSYYYRVYAKKEGRFVLGNVDSFSLRRNLTFNIDQEGIENNSARLEGLVVGLEDFGQSVTQHGFLIKEAALSNAFRLEDAGVQVLELGRLNDDGSFNGTFNDLNFNSSYRAKAFLQINNKIITSSNTIGFKIKGGWRKVVEVVFNSPFSGSVVAVINEFAYITQGCSDTRFCNEYTNVVENLWRYNPSTKELIELSPFPGRVRKNGVAFVLQNRIYIGLGNHSISTSPEYYNDFWEFDPLGGGSELGSWRKVESFPTSGREGAVAFVLGDKAFVGTGKGKEDGRQVIYDDFYIFHPPISPTDSGHWIPYNDPLPILNGNVEKKLGRFEAVAFTLPGQKAVVGTGRYLDPIQRYATDLWEFSESSGWQAIAPLEDVKEGRHKAVAFSIGNKGYITTGWNRLDGTYFNNLWEMDFDEPQSNWERKTDLPSVKRYDSVGFSIGDKGYLGGGINPLFEDNNVLRDLWEYTPEKN